MKRLVLDVGANNGMSTWHFLDDTSVELFAFEPNAVLYRDLCKKAETNKRYHPMPYAVGEKDGESSFHLAGPVDPSNPLRHQEGISNYGCSSLLPFSANVAEEWPGRIDFKEFAEVPVKTVRLETFMRELHLDEIDYLHIDAQGMDLAVLRSLGPYLSKVKEGVLEAPINEKKKIYEGSHTCEEAILFLLNNKFRITNIEKNDDRGNEVNIYFKRSE